MLNHSYLLLGRLLSQVHVLLGTATLISCSILIFHRVLHFYHIVERKNAIASTLLNS